MLDSVVERSIAPDFVVERSAELGSIVEHSAMPGSAVGLGRRFACLRLQAEEPLRLLQQLLLQSQRL